MSQKDNIAGLQSILEAVNTLPESGGGGNNVYADVEISESISATTEICYLGENGITTASELGTYRCLVPSIMYINRQFGNATYGINGNIVRKESVSDGTFTLMVFSISGSGNVHFDLSGGSN